MKTFILFSLAVFTAIIYQTSAQSCSVSTGNSKVSPFVTPFLANATARRQRFMDSSNNRVRPFIKDALVYKMAEIKKARDALQATLNRYPFNRISNRVRADLLRTNYQQLIAQADEAYNFAMSVNTYSTERGAIRNYDQPTVQNVVLPYPYDALLNEFCRDYQGIIYNFEDAYIGNKTCAEEQIPKAPSPLTFYPPHYDDLSKVEEAARQNITASFPDYKSAVDSSLATLIYEDARLRSTMVAPNNFIDQLTAAPISHRLGDVKTIGASLAFKAREAYITNYRQLLVYPMFDKYFEVYKYVIICCQY